MIIRYVRVHGYNELTVVTNRFQWYHRVCYNRVWLYYHHLGRFREFYYWDTYWIVKALLHCDMAQTVKGIIENFLSMVQTYGIVPNGGRIYYLKRSQPPFLTLMVKVKPNMLLNQSDSWESSNNKFTMLFFESTGILGQNSRCPICPSSSGNPGNGARILGNSTKHWCSGIWAIHTILPFYWEK
jgi:hypothetical protein